MSNGKTIEQLNRELSNKINEKALRDSTSQYAGKFLGLANGRVVAVADDLNMERSAKSSLD